MRLRRSSADLVPGVILGSLAVLAGFRVADHEIPFAEVAVLASTFGVVLVSAACLSWRLRHRARAQSAQSCPGHLALLDQLEDGSPVRPRSNALSRLCGDGRILGCQAAADRPADAPSDHNASSKTTSAAVRRAIQSSLVSTAFQPIVSVGSAQLLGAEALSRFSIPGDERAPQTWFADAGKVGLGVELELHVSLLALDAATILPRDAYVSINLSPETLLSPGLVDALTRTPIRPPRIVIEITEHSRVDDYDGLTRALRPLREMGVRLAVDDAGAGHANFRHILRLHPEFIKLDRSLIVGIDSDPAQRALARAIVRFAADVKATVIAEGIETASELDAVRSLDVGAAQGYLLGRPTADATDWLKWEHASPPPLRTLDLRSRSAGVKSR